MTIIPTFLTWNELDNTGKEATQELLSPSSVHKPTTQQRSNQSPIMQAVFTLALALSAFLGGCAGAADAKSSSVSAPVPSTEDAQAVPQTAAVTHTELRLNALGRVGGSALATFVARRNVDGDFSYQNPRLSAGRRGQPPPRKMNT